MANYNKVILVGNLTRDPQLRYLPSNMAVCDFGLAVNRRWRDRDGNQKEDVCFIDISAFGKQGETINQYVRKGQPILIEGHLRLETWTGQDGQKRSKHSVIVDGFQFLGGRGEPSEGRSAGAAYDRGAPPADTSSASYDQAPADAGPPAGDDIPF